MSDDNFAIHTYEGRSHSGGFGGGEESNARHHYRTIRHKESNDRDRSKFIDQLLAKHGMYKMIETQQRSAAA